MLIRTFFSVLRQTLSLIRTSVHLQSQTGRKIKTNTWFYINCGKIYFSLLTNFASPEKWSIQGICSPSPSPTFTLLPVTSTRQQFSLLPCKKYEKVLANRAKGFDLPLERCLTTSPQLSTVTAHLSYWFSVSGWAMRISPFFGSPLCHVNMMTFDMSFQIVFLDQKYR